jgi:phage-related tail fiber protein
MHDFRMTPEEMGYTIKDGRLINMAPSPEMGITKLAEMREGIKRAKKVRMIAEGNELANVNIDLFKKL